MDWIIKGMYDSQECFNNSLAKHDEFETKAIAAGIGKREEL